MNIETGQKYPKSRKLIKPEDGTIAYTWDGKLHNWDGPALILEGNEKKAEYYLYGLQKTKEDWNELRRQREGIPFYKNQSMKNDLSDYRN